MGYRYEWRQAKCVHCDLRFVWPAENKLRVRDANCPKCGAALKATIYYVRLPEVTCRVENGRLIMQDEPHTRPVNQFCLHSSY